MRAPIVDYVPAVVMHDRLLRGQLLKVLPFLRCERLNAVKVAEYDVAETVTSVYKPNAQARRLRSDMKVNAQVRRLRLGR